MADLTDWDSVLNHDPYLDKYIDARDRLHSEEWESGLDDLEELAHKGSLLSMLLVADAMRQGWLYRQDLDMARKWYCSAAESGSLRGLFGLGLTEIMLKDYSAAFEYLTRSADAGYPPALNVLAGMYFRGDLGAKNLAKAEECWKRAIDAGHVSAKVNYSRQRARGRFGIFGVLPGMMDYVSAKEEWERIKSTPDEYDRIR